MKQTFPKVSMSILVIGGAGYVGSKLVPKLLMPVSRNVWKLRSRPSRMVSLPRNGSWNTRQVIKTSTRFSKQVKSILSKKSGPVYVRWCLGCRSVLREGFRVLTEHHLSVLNLHIRRLPLKHRGERRFFSIVTRPQPAHFCGVNYFTAMGAKMKMIKSNTHTMFSFII